MHLDNGLTLPDKESRSCCFSSGENNPCDNIGNINSVTDITGRNVYGTNLLLRVVGADAFFYMYNAHADVTALLTPGGTVAATYDYDPFGNILEQTGDVGNTILFAGYQYDEETGLYYLNARMYDPTTARFLQEDTFMGNAGDPLSLNLYTYCYNSPLRYWDPTGHSAEEIAAIDKKIKSLNESKTHNPGLFAQINALEAEKEILIKQGGSNKITYIKSNQPVVNNAGEAQYTNYLNAKRKNEKEMMNTIVDIVKTNPDLELQITQLLDSSYRNSDDIYWIYDQVMEWQEPFKEQHKDDEVNSLIDDFIISGTEHGHEGIDNIEVYRDDIVKLYLENEMNSDQFAIVLEAFTWIGVSYEFGCDDSNHRDGVDCSGLVLDVYKDAIDYEISKNVSSKRTTESMWRATGENRGEKHIGVYSEKDLRPGDVIFFNLDSSVGTSVTHVAIYVGSGMTIEASSGQGGVIFSKTRNISLVVGFKRYIEE